MRVLGKLVCTQRVEGLGHMHLRILQNNKGKKLVAVDPVGAREGNYVFTTTGTAARFACPNNPDTITDLTIGGIIALKTFLSKIAKLSVCSKSLLDLKLV